MNVTSVDCRTLLGIFAKYWQPGTVKTRLAQSIGAEPASQLYRLFVQTLLHRFDQVADERLLCYSPPQRRADFAAICAPAWQLDAQRDGDLGQRMTHFFTHSRNTGFAGRVLIGSDSPTLPLDYLEQAFVLLESNAVVLGPSDDGGYYLIGVAGEVPPIFDRVAWSTGEVWDQTVGRLRGAGVSFAELPPWYDIDRKEDLVRLQRDLVELSRRSASWSGLLQSVEAVIQK